MTMSPYTLYPLLIFVWVSVYIETENTKNMIFNSSVNIAGGSHKFNILTK